MLGYRAIFEHIIQAGQTLLEFFFSILNFTLDHIIASLNEQGPLDQMLFFQLFLFISFQ